MQKNNITWDIPDAGWVFYQNLVGIVVDESRVSQLCPAKHSWCNWKCIQNHVSYVWSHISVALEIYKNKTKSNRNEMYSQW